MRVVVIGASGTIGSAVMAELSTRHEVIPAGRTRGRLLVDIGDPKSIETMFDRAGEVDAVVCTAAHTVAAPLPELTDAQIADGLRGKLNGQAALLVKSTGRLRDGGSVTLTAGRIPPDMPSAALGVLVNEALQAFVRAAAPELPRGLRANVVSPGWVQETLDSMGAGDRRGIAAADLARSYALCVEGTFTGRTLSPEP